MIAHAKQLAVWRFDDGVLVSHVIAYGEDEAVGLFDATMGCEYREEYHNGSVTKVYQIDGDTVLPITFDGGPMVGFTADEWIEYFGQAQFL